MDVGGAGSRESGEQGIRGAVDQGSGEQGAVDQGAGEQGSGEQWIREQESEIRNQESGMRNEAKVIAAIRKSHPKSPKQNTPRKTQTHLPLIK